MIRHILLDSFPLSAICQPIRNAGVQAIKHWTTNCLAAGHRLYIPEVIDYELRRELIRAGKTNSVFRLDGYKTTLRYLPITTEAMLRAADLWRWHAKPVYRPVTQRNSIST